MIRNILNIILLCASTLGFSQSTYQNYTVETIYKEGRSPNGNYVSNTNDFVTVTYYNGMGQPIQQIQKNASPVDNKNIVTHIEYEKNKGQTKNYLPYTTTGENVTFIADARQQTMVFYTTYNEYTENPYSETRYELALNGRVTEVGAPGYDGSISVYESYGVPEDERYTIRYKYDFNKANEVKRFDVSSDWNASREVFTNSITENGFYPANSLKKTITRNENWKAHDGLNNTIEEFIGSDGKVLLKRTYNNSIAHDTYYVYDFYGNLAYVIPPLANGLATADNLDKLCYQYVYDEKNRLVEKKQPQKQWEYIVYDKADRIVMTGPVNNPFDASAVSGWIVTKYDNQSRTLYTGFYNGHTVTAENRKTIKNLIDAQTDHNESKNTSNTTIDGVTTRYTNIKFPTTFNLLTVNYYDDYQFPNAPATLPAVEGVTTVANVKGLATGSWTRILTNINEHKADVMYTLYNSKYQPIRTYTTTYLGGYLQTDHVLTFRGVPTKTITTHKKDTNTTTLTVTNNYTYDNRERLKKHTQQINGGTAKTIAENTYDELGVLITKKIGGTTTPLQKIDYKYNIRGWLTDINNANNFDNENDLFNFKIDYIFNGNIRRVLSRTKTDNLIKGYSYYYDNLNRLTQAKNLYNKDSGWMMGMGEDEAYGEAITYDKNGNILTMNRTGELISEQAIEVDDLTYTYNANQLQSVTDATNNTEGFNDGNKIGTDYTYDAFGNLKADKNKKITNITYNHLNLPTEITFAIGKITYTYDATGNKLKKVVQPTNGVAQTIDYLYGFQYLNGVLQFFPHAEGYVKPTGTNSYLYVYQYKDHLGNVRLSYADCDGDGVINPATEILEENNYYPFGLKHKGYNEIANSCRSEEAEAYKFLNKEYTDSFALNVTETDFRHYDSALGRFNVIDKLSELAPNHTPYRYGFNNPVYFKDPSGLFETWNQAISYMLEHGMSGTIMRSDYDDTFVIAGSDEFSGRYWENFYETAYHPIEVGKGGGGSGGGSGNGGFGLSSATWLANTGLGMVSTDVTLQSGFLKSNELWHKTKTRGYSFATQDKWKNSGAKYWRNQQVKPYQSARKLGSKLTKAGGVLVAADVVMSGQMKPSHYISGGMLAASSTGVGSIVAGVWFVADMGTGAYNYYFSDDGFRTLSDVIDESSFGQSVTVDMYDGLY